MAHRRGVLGSNNKDLYGSILTFKNDRTEVVIVREGRGNTLTAQVRDACSYVVEHDDPGPWRILSVSNPDTIHRDLTEPQMVERGWDAKQKPRRRKTDPYGEGATAEEVLGMNSRVRMVSP